MEEVIDVVTGEKGNIFESFDIKLSGTVPFPRLDGDFFEFEVPFWIGGFIKVAFCKFTKQLVEEKHILQEWILSSLFTLYVVQ